MPTGFDVLDSAELEALLEAPVLITALVGAADGQFDREEQTWSERLVHVFTYKNHPAISHLYQRVVPGFVEKVEQKLAGLPAAANERNPLLAAQLSGLNAILAKLDARTGAALYKSFVALAQETAKASGGFLRLGAVSNAEHHWVNLPMLTPVQAPVEPVEEEEAENSAD